MGAKQFLGEFEELVLLAILKLGSNAYGAAIAETIEAATGKRVSTGALYSTLSRLDEKKFTSSWWGEITNERGGKRKRYFRIEGAGKAALASSDESRRVLRSELAPG